MPKKLNKCEVPPTYAEKKKEKEFDTLIFIDTNIFLDFYRIRNNVSIKYLNEISQHEDLIIISNQIEMEFKKNRQSAIRESIFETTKKPVIGLSYPAIVSDHESLEKIKNSKKDIETEQSKIKETIEQILKKPSKYDRVYILLEKIFKTPRKINLTRSDEKMFEIRDLASKRFTLGYPPRKKDDNSIGDAINWEWIIDCAIREDKNIIIVTRDGDYGTIDKDDCYLNDWLLEEFKDRVGNTKNIRLTDKLSEAFKWVQIPVTPDMIEEEQKVININNAWDYMTTRRMQEDISNIRTLIDRSSWDSILMDRISNIHLPSWTERLNMEKPELNQHILNPLYAPLEYLYKKPVANSDSRNE
ncbi:hypothetical protein EG347_11635 [Chryseobacterium sp. G0186]|uniref:PIN domain-containing protein n=1 Tax=Chryseobacterium sp. G0186 TaxID=2487064 RepID=UPI000F511CA5|nr:PIN domain-containing protein [Chryseobacterium sp. G0186]AZA78118.1 hypothetical protein EG347_11635 [Chryseobacterium sp. G0186]